MKRYLLPLLLLTGAAFFPTHQAAAQEKPVLQSAPPGAPVPAPPRPVDPVANPTPAPAQPVPAPQPTQDPVPQPTPDRPSGLDLPGSREAREAAKAEAARTKFFIYSGFSLGYNSFFAGNAQVSQFVIGASPALGYRVNDRLAVGPGITYSYSNNSVDYGGNSAGQTLKSNNFGVKAFAQFRVYEQFFAHGEYEVTRAKVLEYDSNNNPTGRSLSRSIESPLVGAGYRQQFSDRAAADILILYNFNDSFESLYPNPVIRFNFLFNIGK